MCHCQWSSIRCTALRRALTHSLLLHELGIWAIVDDVLAKDRSSQNAVDLLRIDVLLLSVQDKLVALGADVYGGLLAEEDEGENFAVLQDIESAWWKDTQYGWQISTDLLAVLLEEPWGVHAVGDGASDQGQPVEDDRRLIGVLEHQLVQDIENNREHNNGGRNDADLGRRAQLAELLGQRPCDIFEEPHGGAGRVERCTAPVEGYRWCRDLGGGVEMDSQADTTSTRSVKGVESEELGQNQIITESPKTAPNGKERSRWVSTGGLLINV